MARQIHYDVTVYKWPELSEAAKDNARQKYEEHNGGANWFRAEEYLDAIKKLAKHFGGKVVDYSLDWSGGCSPSSMDFEMPTREEIGMTKTGWRRDIWAKLRELGRFNRRTLRGHGDCKLTGMCYDENAIDGFRWAFYRDKENDLNVLMQSAFDSWMKAAHEDYEYDFGDEGMKETAEANEYEYTEDGRMV